MANNFDDIQKITKDNADAALKSFGTVTKSIQAIAVEVADYSKKSFEDGTATVEKLLGVKTLDKAIEIQTDAAKGAYEAFVSRATKISELYADLLKDAYRPVEAAFAKASASAK